jgi:gas vesicle protein
MDEKEVCLMAQTEQMEQLEVEENRNGNPGAFLLGTLLGGLTAAAAMLLYAPQSGVETQEQIRKKAYELRDDFENEIQNRRLDAEDSISTSLKNVAGRLEKVAENLNQRAEDLKETS